MLGNLDNVLDPTNNIAFNQVFCTEKDKSSKNKLNSNTNSPSSPPSPPSFHLGTFHHNSYLIHLDFHSVKGLQARLQQNAQLIDIEVRSHIPSLTTTQLVKFSAAFPTSFAIKISGGEEQFALTLIPKGLGGGGCCSKSVKEKSFTPAFVEDETAEAEAATELAHLIPTLAEKIEALQQETLADPEIAALLSTYIAPSAALGNAPPADLYQKTLTFLESGKKILLLLGGSGSGKTTFGKFLTHHLCKTRSLDNPLILFIPLSHLANPTTRAVEETLESKGFSSDEISELKLNHTFIFILDGYDEMGKKINLYETNQLSLWNAKIILSCRSQYLIGESIPRLFAPKEKSGAQTGVLQELSMVPFTEEEILAYLARYLKQNPHAPWQDPRLYLSYFNKIPGLLSLVSTPFLLYIAAETLPFIVKKHETNGTPLKLFMKDLYAAFMEQWFIRAESKCKKGGKKWKGDLKVAFGNYCERLAKKMYETNQMVIKYTPGVFGEAPSIWEEFFGNQGDSPLLYSGAPLQNAGKNEYTFLHKSLWEYFVSLDGTLKFF